MSVGLMMKEKLRSSCVGGLKEALLRSMALSYNYDVSFSESLYSFLFLYVHSVGIQMNILHLQ